MTHAIRIHQHGGPEVLQWETVDCGHPGPREVLLRHTAVGLNYIDTYHRSGLYPLPALPATVGMEAAGVVEEIGGEVTTCKAGDRVACVSPMGAYCERRLLPPATLIPVPAGISDRQAAAMMLKGMTAQYLLKRTYAVQPGDTIVVHAAAGGVGLILCQWAAHLGATVVGLVSSEAKADLARQHGCHHPLLYSTGDWVKKVRDLTGGKGVPVVYDSAGKDTFEKSIDCLRPRGTMVSFGNASGPVAPISPLLLGQKGSLFLTRPSLYHYTSSRDELLATAADLFDVVQKGVVKIEVNQTYPLRDAAQAHRDLEARMTTGSTVLLP